MSQNISRRGFLTGTFGAAALAVEAAFGLPCRAFADDDQASDGSIVILHTNDVHCAVGEPDKTGSTPLGYAALAAYTKARKETFGDANVTLVDAGDHAQGMAIGTLSKGESLIEIMNACGYDYAIPGNHEFDFGMAQFNRLTGMANAKYLSCNFTDNRTGTPTLMFDSYKIRSYGAGDSQVKIAFVGVTTPATLTASRPSSFWRSDDDHTLAYGFCEDSTGETLYQAVQNSVDAAKSEGADLVILLAHLGQSGSPEIWRSDKLVEHCTGINIVIDGHSHEEYVQVARDKTGASVIITQTGTQFASVGQIIINPQTGRITASTPSYQASLLCEQRKEADPAYINKVDFGRDDSTQDVVNTKLDYIRQQTEVKVGTSKVNLYAYEPGTTEWAVRCHETNLGDFVADAYLYYASNNGVYADLAIVNGGGVRKDILTGDITAGNLIDVNPFNNQLCYTDVSGQDILDALEVSVSSYPNATGDFLQVSEGLKFTARIDIPTPVQYSGTIMTGIDASAERRVRNVTLYGNAIDPAGTYKLICHSYYLIDGGGSYKMLQKENVSLLDLDNVALTEYLQINLHGVIGQEYANPNGRGSITFQNGPDPAPEPGKDPSADQKADTGASTQTTTTKVSKTTSGRLANTGDTTAAATATALASGAIALGLGIAANAEEK